MDLSHWHKISDESSELLLPPSCCTARFGHEINRMDREAATAREEAVHVERRRVVLEALERVERYWAAASSVLPADDATILASKVMAKCKEEIRAAGCICPCIDIHTLGEAPGTRFVPGFDPRCGLHAKAGE